MLEEYRKHVAERAAEGIVPKPLDATQMAALVELLKAPPAGEEEFLLDLLINRVPRASMKPPMSKPVSSLPSRKAKRLPH